MNIHHVCALILSHLKCGRLYMAERFLALIPHSENDLLIVQEVKQIMKLYRKIHESIYTINASPLELQKTIQLRTKINKHIEYIISQGRVFYATNESCMIPNLSQIYELILGRKNVGVFVEVGAFDGRTQSNTDCLPPLGWTGLYIEPIQKYYEQCIQWHHATPLVQVANCAAGATEGEIELLVGGVLTTSNVDIVKKWESIDWASKYFDEPESVKVKQYTLDALLVLYNINREFDVLVVDTEGHEGEVFAGFSLEKWLPRIAIVELADQSAQFRDMDKIALECELIRRRFNNAGYYCIYNDDTNTVFVRK